jgi:hypothetical protein
MKKLLDLLVLIGLAIVAAVSLGLGRGGPKDEGREMRDKG